MRYHNTVQVDQQVYNNFKEFLEDKKSKDEIFDRLTTGNLNAHLTSLMKGLTAKVFRTFNASKTMQEELDKWGSKKNKNASVEDKLLFFQRASMQVAVLCNHQRSVPKTHSIQVEKLETVIKDTEDEIEELKEHISRLKAGKAPKERKKKEKKRKFRKKTRKMKVTVRKERKKEKAKEKERTKMMMMKMMMTTFPNLFLLLLNLVRKNLKA